MTAGHLYGLGVGPGDPELITLKAHRLLQEVDAVAWFAAAGRQSNARRAAASHLRPGVPELSLTYPVTTEELPDGVSYERLLADFYDRSAATVAAELDAGHDVAVLCEGDPLFYGSYMYLHNRLAGRYHSTVVPGVPSMLASAAVLGTPLVCLNEALTVLSGVLPAATLTERLRSCDAAVVMKLGRQLAKVRDCVAEAGLLERAWYVERATMANQAVCRLADADAATAPYFSMVVVPSAAAPLR
jgi:precorrin-2/cobalt-factor-2 C20-methyltransferase